MSIESVMPSNHLIPCHPLLLPPSIFPSIRVFSNESVLRIRWSKYWSFSFSISPFIEYSGLISFRMDWLDLLAVQAIPLTKKVENEVPTANTTRGKASRKTKERSLMSSLSRLLHPQGTGHQEPWRTTVTPLQKTTSLQKPNLKSWNMVT